MLSNYSLYKKLEDKLEKSIKEIRQETSNTYIRIIIPLAMLYSRKFVPEDSVFLEVIIFIIGILIISLTFKPFRTFTTSKSESIKAFFFKLFGTDTTLSDKEVAGAKNQFKNQFKELYKNLYLIKSAISSSNNSAVDLFLIFAEDELKDANKQLRLLKIIIEEHRLQKEDLQYKNFYALANLHDDIINTIQNLTDLKESNKELYHRLYNLELIVKNSD